jgi:hypothetical protein
VRRKPASAKLARKHSKRNRRKVLHGLPANASFQIIHDSDARTSAVIECKSSQNLLIPNDFGTLKARYEQSVAHQTQPANRSRSKNWVHISDPFGQLFVTRFGALCSARKTYFVLLDEQMQVRVTGAWFTEHRSFIRAWACFIRLAGNFEGTAIGGLPRGWLPSTPL